MAEADDSQVKMIDTGTDKSETPSDTTSADTKPKPLLKLGARRRFGAKREEGEEEVKGPKTEVCPFKDCGRQFASDKMLKQHIERRHPTPKQTYTSVMVGPATTPIPEKAKVS